MRRIYIYQDKHWPHFLWDNESLMPLLARVRHLQGLVQGKMQSLGVTLQEDAVFETISLDVIKTSEIEGEQLNMQQVRSSVARHLGIHIPGMIKADRHVDGIVEMMLDATHQYKKELTKERLFAWHSSLFPGGRSGMYKILVGSWRDDSTGPMQVVSGALGKEKVHYQAPDAAVINKEMKAFLKWFNNEDLSLDPVLKAGIAHLWFVTLHPFDDGNGRIARAITDLQLARADESPKRFYSMSAQIRLERKEYYQILEHTQKMGMDITPWLTWFLNCLFAALQNTQQTLHRVLNKAHFWEKHRSTLLNDRQKMMLNKLLDDFEGKLSSSKWAKMTKCSQDTALRDIQDLINKKVLKKEEAGGRSTNYELIF